VARDMSCLGMFLHVLTVRPEGAFGRPVGDCRVGLVTLGRFSRSTATSSLASRWSPQRSRGIGTLSAGECSRNLRRAGNAMPAEMTHRTPSKNRNQRGLTRTPRNVGPPRPSGESRRGLQRGGQDAGETPALREASPHRCVCRPRQTSRSAGVPPALLERRTLICSRKIAFQKQLWPTQERGERLTFRGIRIDPTPLLHILTIGHHLRLPDQRLRSTRGKEGATCREPCAWGG